MLTRRTLIAGSALGLCAPALAQSNGPIRIVLPYTAGSTGDIIIRTILDEMSKRIGRPMFVENRTGAGGNIGAAIVASAPPDGSTLLLGASNNFTINQYLFKNLAYDPATAFKSIGIVADIPNVYFTNVVTGFQTLKNLIRAAADKPDGLNYGSPGPGTPPHLAGELLSREAGIKMRHVPFRDGLINGLVRDDVQLFSLGYGTVAGLVAEKQLVPLAVAAPARLANAPDVPTTIEAGYPNVLVSNWWGLAAPKNTPDPFCRDIATALQETLKQSQIIGRFEQQSYVPVGGTTAEMDERIKAESARWSKLIAELKLSLDP